MTQTLERGIAALRRLPPDRQDRAGEMVLIVAAQLGDGPSLSAAQIAEVDLALAEADREDYASDADMEAIWSRGD